MFYLAGLLHFPPEIAWCKPMSVLLENLHAQAIYKYWHKQVTDALSYVIKIYSQAPQSTNKASSSGTNSLALIKHI